jgi:hypothetical protein
MGRAQSEPLLSTLEVVMKSVLAFLAFLSVLIGAPALADEARTNPLAQEITTGQIVICDTQKQVERLVAYSHTGNPSSAIKAVNAEVANPTACGIADAAYVRGAPVGIIRTATEAFQILPVLVVAIRTPDGMRPTTPSIFFTLVKLKEVAV